MNSQLTVSSHVLMSTWNAVFWSLLEILLVNLLMVRPIKFKSLTLTVYLHFDWYMNAFLTYNNIVAQNIWMLTGQTLQCI